VTLPVADVDRAKSFYLDQASFGLDVDHRAADTFRVVQLTPPGSACSFAACTFASRPFAPRVRGI